MTNAEPNNHNEEQHRSDDRSKTHQKFVEVLIEHDATHVM